MASKGNGGSSGGSFFQDYQSKQQAASSAPAKTSGSAEQAKAPSLEQYKAAQYAQYMDKYMPKYATHEQHQYAQATGKIDKFNQAVDYLNSGNTDSKTTQHYLDEANKEAKNTEPTASNADLHNKWMKMANALDEQRDIDTQREKAQQAEQEKQASAANYRQYQDDIQKLQQEGQTRSQIWVDGIYMGEDKQIADSYAKRIADLQEKAEKERQAAGDAIGLNTGEAIGANLEHGTWHGIMGIGQAGAAEIGKGISSDDANSFFGRSAAANQGKLNQEYGEQLKSIWNGDGSVRGKLKDTLFSTYHFGMQSMEKGAARNDAIYVGQNAMNYLLRKWALPNITGSDDADANAAWLTGKAYDATDKLTEKVSEWEPMKYISDENLQSAMKSSSGGAKLAGQVSDVIGRMLPSMAVSWATKDPNAGRLVMAQSAGGAAAAEAYRNGATAEQAYYIGREKGFIEWLSEGLFEGIGLLGGGVLSDGMKKVLGDFALTKLGRVLTKAGDILGENAEEAASDWADPGVDKAVLGQLPEGEEDLSMIQALLGQAPWTEQGLITLISTLVLGGISDVSQNGMHRVNQEQAQEILTIAQNSGNERLASLAAEYADLIEKRGSMGAKQFSEFAEATKQRIGEEEFNRKLQEQRQKAENPGANNMAMFSDPATGLSADQLTLAKTPDSAAMDGMKTNAAAWLSAKLSGAETGESILGNYTDPAFIEDLPDGAKQAAQAFASTEGAEAAVQNIMNYVAEIAAQNQGEWDDAKSNAAAGYVLGTLSNLFQGGQEVDQKRQQSIAAEAAEFANRGLTIDEAIAEAQQTAQKSITAKPVPVQAVPPAQDSAGTAWTGDWKSWVEAALSGGALSDTDINTIYSRPEARKAFEELKEISLDDMSEEEAKSYIGMAAGTMTKVAEQEQTQETPTEAAESNPAREWVNSRQEAQKAAEAGLNDTESKDSKKTSKADKKYEKMVLDRLKQRMKDGILKRGTISYDGGELNGQKVNGVDPNNLTKQQRSAVKAAEAVADALGLDIVFFSDPAKDGNIKLGAWQGDKLYLNMDGAIRANKNGKTTSRFIVGATLSHELTHYLQKYDKEGYAQLRDFVERTILEKDAASMERMIKQQIAMNPTMKPEEALDEIVANACQEMLYDNEVVKQLARQNMTLFEKIVDIFDSVGNRIKGAFAEVDLGDSELYRAARLMKGEEETLKKIWSRDLLTATENFQNQQGQEKTAQDVGVNSGGVKINDNTADDSITVDTNPVVSDLHPQNGSSLIQYQAYTELEDLPKQIFTVKGDSRMLVDETGKNVNLSVRDIRNAVAQANGISADKIAKVNQFLDQVEKKMKGYELKYRFVGLQDIDNATILLDRSGNIILSAMVKNDEYAVNFDFTKLCKKRQALQQVIEVLAREKGRASENGTTEVDLSAGNVQMINEMLAASGVETNCLGCFVEAKRANQQQLNSYILDDWNAIVDELAPGAEYFHFADAEGDVNLHDSEEDKAAFAAYREAYSRLSAELKKEGKKVTPAMNARLLIENVPAARKKLTYSDLVTERGRTRLHQEFPEIDSFAKARLGTASFKTVESFAPYNAEVELLGQKSVKVENGKLVVKKDDGSLRKELAKIGGARSQSFSDFIISHVYDVLQKTAGFAARGLPAHTYTKEISRASLFGKTGEKHNMSVLFEVDPNVDSWSAGLTKGGNFFVGDYQHFMMQEGQEGKAHFIQSIGFEDARKLQNTDGYSKNCGIIAVPLSYRAYKKALADPDIRMIIGYHSSGMPVEVKSKTHYDKAADYQGVQNTQKVVKLVKPNYEIPEGIPSYATPPSDVKPISGGSKTIKSDMTFDIKGRFEELSAGKTGDARTAAAKQTLQEFLDFMNENGLTAVTSKAEGGYGKFPLYDDVEKTRDPYLTADHYIEYCIEKGELPLFWEFATDQNYYKQLYDFNMFDRLTYNSKTGRHEDMPGREAYAPQEAIHLLDSDGELMLPKDFFELMEKYTADYNYQMQKVSEVVPSVLEAFKNESGKTQAAQGQTYNPNIFDPIGTLTEKPKQTGTGKTQTAKPQDTADILAETATGKTGKKGTKLNWNDRSSGKEKTSEYYSNTATKNGKAKELNETNFKYVPIPEQKSIRRAATKVANNYDEVLADLYGNRTWLSEQVDAAWLISDKLHNEAVATGTKEAWDAYNKFEELIQDHATEAGAALQAFAKQSRPGSAAVMRAAQARINAIREARAEAEKAGKTKGLVSEEALKKAEEKTREYATRMGKLEYEIDQKIKGGMSEEKARNEAKNAYLDLIDEINTFRHTGLFQDAGKQADAREAAKANKEVKKLNTKFRKMLEKEDMEYIMRFAATDMAGISSDTQYDGKQDFRKRLNTWQKLAQLTGTGTWLRNGVGNGSFGIVDVLAADNPVTILADALLSAKTGKRSSGFETGILNKVARDAAAHSLRRSILEVAANIDIDSESDKTKYDMGTTRTYDPDSENVLTRIGSRWEQWNGYMLQSSDAWFKGMAKGSAEAAIRKANHWDKGNLTKAERANMDKDKAEKLSKKRQAEIDETVRQIAEYRTFQNDSMLSKGADKAREGLNKFGAGLIGRKWQQGQFGLGTALMPYTKVPTNLAMKAVEFSPAGALNGLREMIQVMNNPNATMAQQQKAVTDFGRGVTGTALVAVLASLMKQFKFFRDWDDEDDKDVKAQNRAEGKYGMQFNIDMIKRWANGDKNPTWENGDRTLDISSMEPLNQLIGAASLLADDEELTAKGILEAFTKAAHDSLNNMPALQTLANIENTIRYTDTPDDLWQTLVTTTASTAGNVAGGMIPAPIKHYAALTDKNVRDTSGENAKERAINQAKSAVPGLRQTLPVKRDSFGNEMKAGDFATRFANQYDAFKHTQVNQSDVSRELERLREETGVSRMPSRNGPSSITFGSGKDKETIKLKGQERTDYRNVEGSVTNMTLEELFGLPLYKNADDDTKDAMVAELKSFANDTTKGYFADYNDIDYEGEYTSAREAEDPIAFLTAKTGFNLAKGANDWDAVDELIKTVRAGRLSEAEQDVYEEHMQGFKKLYAMAGSGIGSKRVTDFADALKTQYESEKRTDARGSDYIRTACSGKFTDKEADTFMSYAPDISPKTIDNYREQVQYQLSQAGMSDVYDGVWDGIEQVVNGDIEKSVFNKWVDKNVPIQYRQELKDICTNYAKDRHEAGKTVYGIYDSVRAAGFSPKEALAFYEAIDANYNGSMAKGEYKRALRQVFGDKVGRTIWNNMKERGVQYVTGRY